ncbi:MAG: hypothetical protein BJ554DRAFT_6919, partial [Olpidium bornovanus]
HLKKEAGFSSNFLGGSHDPGRVLAGVPRLLREPDERLDVPAETAEEERPTRRIPEAVPSRPAMPQPGFQQLPSQPDAAGDAVPPAPEADPPLHSQRQRRPRLRASGAGGRGEAARRRERGGEGQGEPGETGADHEGARFWTASPGF